MMATHTREIQDFPQTLSYSQKVNEELAFYLLLAFLS